MDSINEIEEEEQFVVGAPDGDAVNNEDANLPTLLLVILMLPVSCGNILHFPVTNQRKCKDPHIVNCTQECNDYISSCKLDHATGL